MDMQQFVRIDQGEINARLLARIASEDLAKVESASRKVPVSLCSPEVKRLFLRNYNSMQRQMHFISVVSRYSLPGAEVDEVERKVTILLERNIRLANAAIVRSKGKCERNGITSLASYDAQPLEVEARVISPFGRRLLDLFLILDQLMPMLETLALDDVLSNETVFATKCTCRRWVRMIVGEVRAHAGRLTKRLPGPDDRRSGKVYSNKKDPR
ncbi:DUF1845 domain-containing protein [Massilia sp. TS11]|uniref:DUF1845 domain-containing protein n=1 Tax=Massilia sp. TS11 TaxID=2908003 RepID=UPI001EDC350F|nr:DUF1845 domain-containing protein [Massilia sp. TS11]MCG2583905.1 DUF1845 domain-containing protein [Massilia sp. TS11]